MATVYYTKQRLKTAYKKGDIAFILANNFVISFMFKDDPDTVGFLVSSGENIRRFKTDYLAQVFIDKLKGEYI